MKSAVAPTSVVALAGRSSVVAPRKVSVKEPLVAPHVKFCTSKVWLTLLVFGSSPGAHRRSVQS